MREIDGSTAELQYRPRALAATRGVSDRPVIPRTTAPAHLLVVFGVTSDLATRQTIPSLAEIAQRGQLPEPFVLLGVALEDLSDEDFRRSCLAAGAPEPNPRWAELVAGFRYIAGNFSDATTYERLRAVIAEVEREHATGGNRIFYLATFPSLLQGIVAGLNTTGLSDPGAAGAFSRAVVEKPFASDLASARDLERLLAERFAPDDIFRMDHFTGMDPNLNLLALRFSNATFEAVWNRHYIDHIQMTAADPLGVGHRGFYDEAGQLRDVFQNHLMQLLCFLMMEPPTSLDAGGLSAARLQFLRHFEITEPVADSVVRAQYTAGVLEGVHLPGYSEGAAVAPESMTETYLAVRAQVNNERWSGVPVYVRSGKRHPHQASQITVVFKPPANPLFSAPDGSQPPGQVLRIQQRNGIALSFGALIPDAGFVVRPVDLSFSYSEAFPWPRSMVYARLLFAAMVGDATFYIGPQEIDRAWEIVGPIQELFASGKPPLSSYPAGTWGPVEAEGLIAATGHHWIEADTMPA